MLKIFMMLILFFTINYSYAGNFTDFKDGEGNMSIRNGNYRCGYKVLNGAKESEMSSDDIFLYTERVGNGINFIINMPDESSISSPYLPQVIKTKNIASYVGSEENGLSYLITNVKYDGIFLSIGNSNNSLLIGNCNLSRDLE